MDKNEKVFDELIARWHKKINNWQKLAEEIKALHEKLMISRGSSCSFSDFGRNSEDKIENILEEVLFEKQWEIFRSIENFQFMMEDRPSGNYILDLDGKLQKLQELGEAIYQFKLEKRKEKNNE